MTEHTKPRSTLKVRVSDHARERARQRFPGFKAARIIDEVHAGLVAGRLSAEQPFWCGSGRSSHDRGLYVWTATGERVYVLEADHFHGYQSYIVVTTLVGGRR